MKIIVTGLFVEDQDKALSFYTETLGFLKNGNYSAIVLKKVQTNSKQKANANPIVDAVG